MEKIGRYSHARPSLDKKETRKHCLSMKSQQGSGFVTATAALISLRWAGSVPVEEPDVAVAPASRLYI